MTPGFNIKTGAHLKAKIEACDDGNIPLQGTEPETKAAATNPPESQGKRKPGKD